MNDPRFGIPGDNQVIREELEKIRARHIEDLRKGLEEIRAMESLFVSSIEALQGIERLKSKRTHEYYEDFLREFGKPATIDEIQEAIVKLGADLGRRDPLGRLQRSLTQSVNAGRLRTTEDGKYELANK